MPPKTRITRNMIIDAGFEIARTEGVEQINARTVSKALGCSTQPVMYQFEKIEDLKRAVYEKADCFHSEFLMNMSGDIDDFMLGMGLNYIRFAVEEPYLFRFLFQSGFVAENSLIDMMDSEELKPVMFAMQEGLSLNEEQTKEMFLTIAMFAHGYASIIANNSLEFDEEIITRHLNTVYRGAILAVKEM